jgi:phage gp36-like protein
LPSYASIVDLNNFGLPASAYGSLTDGQINAQLEAASEEIDGYAQPRFGPPGANGLVFQAWPDSITMAACDIASWKLLKLRGFNPMAGADVAVQATYQDRITWLVRLQKGMISPPGLMPWPSPSNNQQFLQPRILSSSMVGISSGRRAPTRMW